MAMMNRDRAKQNYGPKPLTKQQASELVFDYKSIEVLKRFMTERGSIIPRERTGLSSKQQRKLSQEIKRARHLALLPFVTTL
jgi:small subunit ribosomal protein S18